MKWPRLFNRKSTEARTTQGQVFIKRSASGVHVDAMISMRASAVYAGIRYIAQTVGQLPWYANAPRADGGADRLVEPRFQGVRDVMMNMANPRMNLSAQRFREVMIEHAILYGNGVAEIERGAAGRVAGLYPLQPEKLQFYSENGEDLIYIYTDDRRGQIRFKPQDVFHITNFGSRQEMPSLGVSVVEYAAESIGWQRATELFGSAYFQNGINPSVLISLKQSLSPEAYKLFNEELTAKFSGSRNAHQAFVTDTEADVKKFSIQPNESQFIESLQHQTDEIARWIGVPPSKIGHLIHSGVRANVEHASIEAIQDSVLPWVRRFEQEADTKFFRPGDAYFTRMDVAALLRGDSKSRAEYFRTLRNLGAINADDIRIIEGMNPLPAGAGGQEYIVQGQYVPLSEVSRIKLGVSPSGQDTEQGRADDEGPALSDAEAIAEFRRTNYLLGD